MQGKNKSDMVRVACRINGMGSDSMIKLNETTLILEKDHGSIKYNFNKIFGPRTTQLDVFEYYADRVETFIQNEVDTVLFAYGQTGSGKTYTLFGDFGAKNSEEKGLINRTLKYVCEGVIYKYSNFKSDTNFKNASIKAQSSNFVKPQVAISMFEINTDKVYDLLNPDFNEIKVQEKKTGSVNMQELSCIEIDNEKHGLDLITNCFKKRKSNHKIQNVHLSKSHVILKIGIYKNYKEIASLYICDLAGSEKIKSCNNLHEVSSINNSLNSLGMCIYALILNRDYVPLRNSKLTRILANVLTLESQIDLIVCLKEGVDNVKESYETLQFANKVTKNNKKGKEKPSKSTKNQKENISPFSQKNSISYL